MIVSENQSQGQGQGGNQSQVQGGFYGVEKGHMILNMSNDLTYDYYFSDYGKTEYYLTESDNGKAIGFVDHNSKKAAM